MATRSLGSLTVDLIAKIGGFEKGMSQAERHTRRSSGQMTKDLKKVGVALAAVGVAAVTGAAAGIAVVVKRQRQLIDDQAKLAQRLNTTYESLSNLGRAGELAGVSMETISRVGERLSVNLGKALQGVGAQAEAIERLNLNATELAALPLDERISKINIALRENVSQAERAAVASDLFGSRNAVWVQMLESGVIEEAARQVEIFGLNLSDVDAAKVEMANDAMSTFGLLVDGIQKRLTVELAPILKAIGDEFLRSSEAAGGLGNVVAEGVKTAIEAISFLVNAGDILYRTFRVTADLIIVIWSDISGAAADAVAIILEAISKIPGATKLFGDGLNDAIRSVREFQQTANYIERQAEKRLSESLNTPLRGSQFKDFALNAIEAGQAAAEAAIGARKLGSAVDNVGESTAEAAENQKKRNEAQKAYQDLLNDLMTDEERTNKVIQNRIKILDDAGVSQERYGQILQKILRQSVGEAPSFEGLDSSVFGISNELLKIQKYSDELEKWRETERGRVLKFQEEAEGDHQAYRDRLAEIDEEYNQKAADLARARELTERQILQDQLGNAANLFGSMADLAKVAAGEQSAVYRTLFAISKAFSVVQSIMAIKTGIALAAANPFPANLGAMATVASATAGLVGEIQGLQFTGMAHDGLDFVPQEGTWLLDRGERVVDSRTNSDLKQYLDKQREERAAGMAPVVNLFEDKRRAGQVERGQDGSITAFVSDIRGGGPMSRALAATYGLKRRGA